jgi:isoquinoline 1-oxidoreductase beta subunit
MDTALDTPGTGADVSGADYDRGGMSRRAAVIAMLSAGGGLALGIPLNAEAASATGQPKPMGPQLQSPEAAPQNELSAWVVIDPDDSVTLRIPHNEMGQGTSTALAMILAEELQCDWSKVKCEYASATRNAREKNVYGSMTTVGSQGVRSSWKTLQQAGASARQRLIEAAAKRWNVSAADCKADNGVITHTSSKRKIGYGAVAKDAALITLAAEPGIKSPEQFRLVGKSTPRLDTRAKVDGSAQYGIDAHVPGMVYAAVISAPVPGSKVKSIDDAAAKAMPGVIAIVPLGTAVAVAADKFWRAKKAADALKVEWEVTATVLQQDQMDKLYRDGTKGPLVSARNDGDAKATLAAPGAKVVEALYEAPYQAHAPMEPLNATVWLQPDRLEVWVSTQSPPSVLNAAAKAAGLPVDKVFVHVNYLGGGFGRRSNPDETLQAIAVAKAVGKPVKLVWTREQDMVQDRFRPQAAAQFRAALTEDGKAHAFDCGVAVGSLFRSLQGPQAVPNGMEPMAVECIAATPYKIPNLSVGAQLINTHVPVSFCRGVGSSQNGFFIESFVDEMAHAAGKDPYRFRRDMLDRADWIGVLDMLAEKSDWKKPLGPGRGRGIAILECYGSVSGQVAEVTVTNGKVKVDRIVAVIDCYHAANPNTIAQQMEGAVAFGLTQTLYGQITVKDGAIQQSNFHNYRPARMADMPVIETYVRQSGGPNWGGIGEPGVGPCPPAVCNAIFAATGKRVRRLPLASVDLTKL